MAIEETRETEGLSDELSLIWGGRSVNDAQLAPYTTRWFLFYWTCFARLSLSRIYGVLYTTNSSYSGLLAPTNPAGTTLRMASGAALNVRLLYLNDANIDWSCAAQGYYRLVVRETFSLNTVRATLIGPTTQGWPQVTRDSYINDITIARVYSTGAALTLYDDRRFFRNIVMPVHSGEASYWYIPNATDQRVRGTLVQCGAFYPQTSPSVDFPRRYPVSTAPVVIMGATGASANHCSKLVNENANGSDAFDYYIDDDTGLTSIYFLSFGMRR